MIDFIVRGTPKSQQSRSKSQWQDRVKQAVPSRLELLGGQLRLRIDFFFNGSTNLDIDNIIKPIQDALENVIYADDKTVFDVCARKIDLQELPPFVSTPPALASALAGPSRDFVYIRVAQAHSRLEFS